MKTLQTQQSPRKSHIHREAFSTAAPNQPGSPGYRSQCSMKGAPALNRSMVRRAGDAQGSDTGGCCPRRHGGSSKESPRTLTFDLEEERTRLRDGSSLFSVRPAAQIVPEHSTACNTELTKMEQGDSGSEPPLHPHCSPVTSLVRLWSRLLEIIISSLVSDDGDVGI
ncbi:hypothetical protein DNTS_016955 [Danionella cerebrum]|uniref:Uncharacterized protein n=1 Tax=Danionella cerebrum TaxID=2873325 RepID=A0A553QG17_9TELE|nr:hypothetical protein DNTS_016955 [Danionella translucida]